VQDLVAAGTGLACTAGTGIIPLCVAAAETWRRAEGRDEQLMSRLAVSTIRGLIGAQVTTILASAGKTRWCELAVIDPGVVRPFLDVFPDAVFVCVHRSCLDVIRTGIQASPWGLQGQGLAPYVLSYPGNNVAALAAWWANSTEELLAFEDANPRVTRRVLYEQAIGAGETLTALRGWLGLGAGGGATLPEYPDSAWPSVQESLPPQVPVEMIPPLLLQRINSLHVKLGYAATPG
jgi:hypothetical protein